MPPRTKPLLTWIALAFGLPWTLAGLFALAGGRWGSPASTMVGVLFMFGPAAATLLVRLGADYPRPYWRALRHDEAIWAKPDRWFGVAVLLPVLLALVTLGASLLLPGVGFSAQMEGMFARFGDQLGPEQLAAMHAQVESLPLHPFWIGLLAALVAGPTVNAIAAFGEELGWRGYLQRELAPMGFWPSSLLIGALWGLWHAPLIVQGHNYPEHPLLGVGLMVVFCMLWAPILGWLRLRSGSVVAAAIGHGAVNASAGLPLLVILGGNDLTVGMTGLAGLAVALVVNLALWATGAGARAAKQRG